MLRLRPFLLSGFLSQWENFDTKLDEKLESARGVIVSGNDRLSLKWLCENNRCVPFNSYRLVG